MLLVVVVVGLSLLVIGALGWRLLGPEGTEEVRPTALAFDPFGGDGENDDQAALATDGDPDTAWPTETYSNPVIGQVKDGGDGVGLLLDLGRSRRAEALSVVSPSTGWAAEVYVMADPPGQDTAAWGEVRAAADELGEEARFDLGGADGRFVLLWITRTADDGRVEVADAVVEVGT